MAINWVQAGGDNDRVRHHRSTGGDRHPKLRYCPDHDIIGDISTLPTCKLAGIAQQPDPTKAHVLE
jgi:hypothetical protein